MPKLVLLLLLLGLYTRAALGQAPAALATLTKPNIVTSGNVDPAVLTYADEMPAYPGGGEALHRYLALKTEYPADAMRQGLSGTVVVQFVVDEQGRLLNPYIVKSSAAELNAEALRLVRLMPWWTPGRQQGQLVRVRCTLPIQFSFRH